MDYSRADDEGRALAYIGSILFSFGLAIFAAVAFSSRALLRAATNNWAASWPTASGEITTCDVKAIHGRFLDYALGIVGYSYQTGDNYYSGYLTRQFWDEQQAWSFVDACKDKSVLVRFKLGKPRISVLREIDQMGVLPPQQHRPDSPNLRFGPVLAILWSLRNVSDWAESILQAKARYWLSTYATVEYAEPMIVGEDRDAHWVGEVHYSYSVDGNSYSQSYYLRATGEDDARDLVEGWRNRRIVVHHFPGNPARSVLIPEEQDRSATTATES
jgi:hypothetical protein